MSLLPSPDRPWRQPQYDPADETFWHCCQDCRVRLNIKELRHVRLSRTDIKALCPDCAGVTSGPCTRCSCECAPASRRVPGYDGPPHIDEGFCPRCLTIEEGRFTFAFLPPLRPSVLADRLILTI